MMGRLTVRQIESAKPTGKRHELNDGDGLKLRVAPDGAKTWYVRFRVNGEQETARLARRYGSRTDDGHLSLEDARREAATIIAKGRDGIDFRIERELRQKEAQATAERERAASLDVQTLFDEWVHDGIAHKDGGKEIRRRFEKDVLPAIATKPVKHVIEKDILAIVRAIAARNAPRMALAMRDALAQMFSWGDRRLPWRRLIELNPATAITDDMVVGREYQESEDTRPLAQKEIPELRGKIAAMRTAYEETTNKRTAPHPLDVKTELAIWIMLSTLCRVSEITRARRTDVDLGRGTWVIPSEHSKNTDPHVIYLSEFARRQFRALLAIPSESNWLFASPTDPDTHIDLKSLTKQIGDRQLAKAKRKPGRKPGKKRVSGPNANALILSGGGWTPHDLRRTGSTIMEALHVLPVVVDRCLNHREPNKLRRIYLRHDYAKEKRTAWQLLGERLDKLLRTDNEAANSDMGSFPASSRRDRPLGKAQGTKTADAQTDTPLMTS